MSSHEGNLGNIPRRKTWKKICRETNHDNSTGAVVLPAKRTLFENGEEVHGDQNKKKKLVVQREGETNDLLAEVVSKPHQSQ